MTDVVHTKPTRTPWNRNDKSGLTISIVAPLLAALLMNGVIYAAGWNGEDAAYEAVAFNPPGWLIAPIWLVIFPMWGAARWYAYQTGLAGRRASYWVSALMAWSLIYPLITAGPNIGVSAGANVVSLGVVLAAASQVRPVSKRAFRLIAPSILWIGFATLLGFAALTHS